MKSAKPFQIEGRHVLAGMVLFFGSVIAVNIVFIVAAVNSFPGEDVRRSYTQGLNYNQTLAERHEQAAQGWRARAALIDTSSGPAVEVIVLDRNGAPLTVEATGALRWPMDSRRDHELAFESRGAGRYIAPLRELEAGRWELRARAVDAAGRALDFEADLLWRV